MRQPKTVPPVSDKAAEDNSFWLTIMVVVLGAFAAILNSSSINVALPKLMTIFGVAENEIEWILTAYMLVSGVAIPITGYFSDRFGIKRVYLTGLALFVVGSVLCSLSWSNETMIASRVIQGIGGGASMPVSMAIVYSIVPRKKIGVALESLGHGGCLRPGCRPYPGRLHNRPF
jgi:MFS family permease